MRKKKKQYNSSSSKLLLDRRELFILTTLRRSHMPTPQSPGSSLQTCGTKKKSGYRTPLSVALCYRSLKTNTVREMSSLQLQRVRHFYLLSQTYQSLKDFFPNFFVAVFSQDRVQDGSLLKSQSAQRSRIASSMLAFSEHFLC